MRTARTIVNSLFSLTAQRLAALPPSQAADTYNSLLTFAAFAGRPMLDGLDPRVVTNTIELLSDGLRRTPYGVPLDLEYPLIISLSVSGYCPYACSNCYSNSGATKARGQTQDRLQLFAKVAASKTPFVIVSGGEPLVTDGITDCLKLLTESGKFVYVSTNALVEPYLEFAQENAGLLRFVLPVWGNRARHNVRRGANSFERLERNLAQLNGVGHKPNLLVVLSDLDYTVFEDVEHLVQAHGVDVVTISRKIDAGRVEAVRPDFKPDDLRNLQHWRSVLQQHVRLVVCDLPELQNTGRSGRLQRLLGLPVHNGCSAGNWMMHVDDGGKGYPCFSFEGDVTQAIGSSLSIAEQWQAVRGLRTLFPTGALCAREQLGRPKEAALDPT